MKKIILACIAAFSLAACNTITGETNDIRIGIPQEKFQCLTPSARPSGPKIMESDVAKYIASLERSNKDCKTKLKEIDIIIQCYNDKKCDVDKKMKETFNEEGLAS